MLVSVMISEHFYSLTVAILSEHLKNMLRRGSKWQDNRKNK